MDWYAAAVLRRYILVSGQAFPCLPENLTNNGRYVAMHAMQEDSISSHSHEGANGFAEIIPSGRKPARPQVRDTFAAVAGMLLPLLTQFGHGH